MPTDSATSSDPVQDDIERNILIAYGRVGIPLAVLYATIAYATFIAPTTDLIAAGTLATTGFVSLAIAAGRLPAGFVHIIPVLLMIAFGGIAKHEDGFESMVFTVLPVFVLILRFLTGPWSASVFAMGLTCWGGILMANPHWVDNQLADHLHPFNHSRLVIILLSNIFVLWFAGVPASMLKKANAKLAKTAIELESRVAARTTELARSNQALEATNSGLDAFSRSVSHDLRAPLRAILGYTKVVLEDDGRNLSAESIAYLEYAIEAANRSNELIDAFLELARSSTKPLEKSWCDLSEMAEKAVDSLRRQDPSRTPEIRVAQGCLAYGDRGLLRSVVENLVSNAWKYTGKVANPRIEFLEETGAEGPTFLVRDNGAGFDMTHSDRLFQNFSRLHSNEDFEGNGIGLSNVYRILERHQGWIKAYGRKGEGAEFRFWLPPETETTA